MGRDRVELAIDRQVRRVVLTGAMFRCTGCGKTKAASAFGLRQSKDEIRNQPQCMSCRDYSSKAAWGTQFMLVF